MKYLIAVKDKEIFRDYIFEEAEYWSLASFEEKDKDKIRNLLLQQFLKENPGCKQDDGILKWYYSSTIDENGVVYIIYFDRKRFYEYGTMSLANFKKAIQRENAAMKRIADKAESVRNKFDENTIVRKPSLIPRYKSFSYFDVNFGIEIPFRLKECKGEGKKPLLIYLHGAGCNGSDNLKPLLEFSTSGIRLKEDCFVLIPQSDNFKGDNIGTINVFTKSVRNIVEKLSEIYPIDNDRIYVTGISYGGACTWYSVYNNPRFYAAAIPLMGYFPDSDSDTFDVDAFNGTKIWAGHAEDDEVVSAQSDKDTYEKLKNVCDIKFSLYKTGGHQMMQKFYRKEKWQEWLFAQKRSGND